jgi:hypothetical protein
MVGSGLVTSGVAVTSTGSGVTSSLSITSSSCFFPEYRSSNSYTKVSSLSSTSNHLLIFAIAPLGLFIASLSALALSKSRFAIISFSCKSLRV